MIPGAVLPMPPHLERLAGLLRSLAIYYVPGRVRRLRRFYAPLIRPGDLCFDIGAHVGNRVTAWRQLGAQVVAVEPQAYLAAWLRRVYGHATGVTIVQAAVGRVAGEATLHHDPRNPTVSSLSEAWIGVVRRDVSFSRVRWDSTEPVQVTTLDALITTHGRPALCKIDVEGYEAEVLHGLSVPLPLVSFEYIPAAMDVAHECLERLCELGDYEFNWFPGESHRWASPGWLPAPEMAAQLDRLAAGRVSGDIFARLLQSPDAGA